MKRQASIFISVLLSASLALANTPGTGAPSNFEYCEHNARAIDSHRPTNIVNAEEALESAEASLTRLEDEFDEANECQAECEETVYNVIRSTVGDRNLQDYLDYLGGSFECYGVANSAVRNYNMYAQQNGWEVIQDTNIAPSRMVACNGGECDETRPGTIAIGDTSGNELGGGGTQTPVVTGPATSAPQHQQCTFMGPNNTLDISICREAQRQGLDGRQIAKCNKCLGPINDYGKCLRRAAGLQQKIYEAQELVEKRKDELDEANANPSSGTTCTGCIEDTRSWWQKLLPTAAAAAMVAIPGYLAYKAAKESYEYAINVTHENNSRLGYASEPTQDLSGYQFAAHLVNGAPLILNTGLSTGLFGCSGSTFYGAGQILSGVLSGSQQGGATGYTADILGGLTTSGNTNGNVVFDANGNIISGGGTATGSSIDARIQANNELLAQIQRDNQILAQRASTTQSLEANRQEYEARNAAILNGTGYSSITDFVNGGGQTNASVTTSGSGSSSGIYNPLAAILGGNGVFQGGVTATGNVSVQTYGNAGFNNGVQVPTTNTPFIPSNQTQVPYTHQTGNSGVTPLVL